MQKSKLFMSLVIETGLLAEIVSKCNKLEFTEDIELSKLALFCKDMATHDIGDEYKKLSEEKRDLMDKIIAPFNDRISEMTNAGASQEEVEAQSAIFNAEANKALNSNEDIKSINRKISKLFEEKPTSEIPVVYISNKDYKCIFDDTEMTDEYMGLTLTMKGYDALKALAARGHVEVKSVNKPSEELVENQ